MIKILGILDIIAGVIFWLSIIFNIPNLFLGIAGIYLLAKALIFIGFGLDILSFFDLISGFAIIASVSINIPIIFVSIISLYLIIKGIISLF